MRRDIVFVHIPKVAGTSLRIALEKSAEGHCILKDYGNSPETTPKLSSLLKEQRLADFRKEFNRDNRGLIVSGHFGAKRYWPFFHAESFVTFVRNPVDRVLSEYNHFVTHYGWTAPVEEFISAPRFRNVMTRALGGVDLKAFGFIGITEEFERNLDELRSFVGARLPLIKMNIGKYEGRGSEVRSHNELRAMIGELNHEDIVLYERLRAERSRTCRAFDGELHPCDGYRGGVNRTPRDGIVGWVCNRTREFICEVEFLQDDRLLGCVKADGYRADLKEKRLSRSGICGFAVDRPTLSQMGADLNGTLTVKVRGSEYALRGSPVNLGPNVTTASA